MQSSKHRSEWDKFWASNYDQLVKIARKHSKDPYDLVNHSYLRCIRLPFPDRPMGYAAVAMFREATRGQFKKAYRIREGIRADIAMEEPSMELSLRREMVQMAVDQLAWFDRQIMNLYLAGWKMTEVSEQSGIEVGTLYQSLHRSRKYITDVICNGTRT